MGMAGGLDSDWGVYYGDDLLTIEKSLLGDANLLQSQAGPLPIRWFLTDYSWGFFLDCLLYTSDAADE